MSENHYEIEIKQGDLHINLCSDDVYFISRQLDKWFKVLLDDSYVPISIPPSRSAAPPVAPAPQPQPLPLPPTAQPALPPALPVEQPVAYAPALAVAPQAPPAPIPEPVYQAPPAPVLPEPPPPVSAAPEIPLQPPAALPPAEKPSEKLDSGVQDDFEAVMDTLMRDLEKGESAPYQATGGQLQKAEPTPIPELQGLPRPHAAPPEPTPPQPLDLSEIETLVELAEKSKASSSEDFLLLTGYFLTHFEGDGKFSLKRINSQLVKSGLTPVNHSVLESTITKGYLTLVPDMTGMADVSEYSLSEAGSQYVLKLLY